MIQRIFFDFGGCIDAPGIHTRTLFWDAFRAEGLQTKEARPVFQDAYTAADQRMMSTGEASKLGLAEFNRWNALLIAQNLSLDETRAAVAGDRVTSLMRGYLTRSREVMQSLHGKYELGVISNFTGNLEVILREFQLLSFFDSVTESYYAGCSKPDPKIFQIALTSQKCAPEHCVYVGDNPVNDIAPVKKLGWKAVLIHPPGQKKECAADGYVEDLGALLTLIQRM